MLFKQQVDGVKCISSACFFPGQLFKLGKIPLWGLIYLITFNVSYYYNYKISQYSIL